MARNVTQFIGESILFRSYKVLGMQGWRLKRVAKMLQSQKCGMRAAITAQSYSPLWGISVVLLVGQPAGICACCALLGMLRVVMP